MIEEWSTQQIIDLLEPDEPPIDRHGKEGRRIVGTIHNRGYIAKIEKPPQSANGSGCPNTPRNLGARPQPPQTRLREISGLALPCAGACRVSAGEPWPVACTCTT